MRRSRSARFLSSDMSTYIRKQNVWPLYRVPLSLILVEADRLSPTGLDRAVVPEDLAYFIQISRIVGCTPDIRVANGQIWLVNGEPFVTAARHATPPVTTVVCRLIERCTALPASIVSVSAKELAEEEFHNVHVPRPMVVCFARVLSDMERNVITAALRERMRPVLDAASMTIDSVFGRTALKWEMPPFDVDDARLRKFCKALCREIRPSVPVSSFNGVSIERTCKGW